MENKIVSVEWVITDNDCTITFNGFNESGISPTEAIGYLEVAKYELLNMDKQAAHAK